MMTTDTWTAAPISSILHMMGVLSGPICLLSIGLYDTQCLHPLDTVRGPVVDTPFCNQLPYLMVAAEIVFMCYLFMTQIKDMFA